MTTYLLSIWVAYDTWSLFNKARGYRPLKTLHDFLMCPRDQHASYEQDAEVTISRLAALSIGCCAAAVFNQANLDQGRRAGVLHSPLFLKNSKLHVPEASMVVNIILKVLQNATYSLLSTVLGTQRGAAPLQVFRNWFRIC